MGSTILPHKDLAGVNFTGSTGTFHTIWQDVAANIDDCKRTRNLSSRVHSRPF